MCGRAVLKASPDEIAAAFDLAEVPELQPRFNIAPTDPMTIVRRARDSEARELTNVRFGLVPFWEDSPASAAKNINARSETIFVKRPFVEAIKKRRCLVVVDGFYEWKRPTPETAAAPAPRTTRGGPKKAKPRSVPYRIHFENDTPFALAGIWERWISKDGEVVESCSIITGPAHGELEGIHDRSPVFVPRDRYTEWLSREGDPKAMLATLVEQTPSWSIDPVSTYVNDVKHQGPECLAPPSPAEEPAAEEAAPGPTTLSLFDRRS